MILALILTSLILAGDKHDRDHHKEHKHRPRYDHEWTERHKIRENQERIIEELRKQKSNEVRQNDCCDKVTTE